MSLNEQISSKATEVALSKCSLPLQYAYVHILGNIMNGVFWSFSEGLDMESARTREAIRASGGHIKARKLGNGYLMEVSPEWVVKEIMKMNKDVGFNILDGDDVKYIAERQQYHLVGFEKFLVAKLQDIKSGNGFSGLVGIYCVNETHFMTYNDISYPAYGVNIVDALKLLTRYGYLVKVDGEYHSGVDIMNSSELRAALWRSIVVSPTRTGLFIDIKAGVPVNMVDGMTESFKASFQG